MIVYIDADFLIILNETYGKDVMNSFALKSSAPSESKQITLVFIYPSRITLTRTATVDKGISHLILPVVVSS